MEFPPQPIDFERELNADQYAAVSAPLGPALVLAGAGSGKTRTLTYRVAWLLTHEHLRPWEILLLTFTNKAAREMLDRVETLTGCERREFWGGTFHHIGQKFLRRHGERVGLKPSYTILDETDAESLLNDVIKQTDPSFAKNKEHPKARVISDVLSYARNTRQSLAQVVEQKYPHLAEILDDLERFAHAYAARKLEQQVTDYDDLLELWLRLLQENPDIAEHYRKFFRTVLVDEYQDTNRLQSEIVDLLAPNHCLMAVGDDAQCIYTWRGADFENILSFTQRHPSARLYKIETNYRSTPEILRLANDVLRSQPADRGFFKELRADRPPGSLPIVGAALDTMQQANAVIRRIRELLDDGTYSAGDIVVLYRAHYHAMDLQLEMSRQGMPFTITSGVRFFEQAHIRDFTAQLRFAHNPADTVAFARVVSLLPGVGPATSQRILKAAHETAHKKALSVIAALTDEKVLAKVPADARDDFRDFALTLQNMEEALGRGAPNASTPAPLPPKSAQAAALKTAQSAQWAQHSLFDEAPSAPAQAEANADEADDEAAAHAPAPAENALAHSPEEIVRIGIEGWYGDYLRNLHANWESRREDLNSLITFAARFDNMDELLSQLVLLSSESGERDADPEAEKIRLTTIHQAKGLEFPVVFVIGLADGLFPLQRAIDDGDVEEERRLFYVSVTRARDQLYLLHPRLMMRNGQLQTLEPSRFLTELNPDLFYFAR